MRYCTWYRCPKPATVPQLDLNGQRWSDLCTEHAQQLEVVCCSSDPKAVLAAWVKAQGGPAAATKRMQPAIEASTRMLTQLNLLKP